MHKIWLIIQREYISRVKKKSFIVMTLLSPFLIALFYGLIFYFTINKEIGDTKKEIVVIDQQILLGSKLKSTKTIDFTYNLTKEQADVLLKEEKINGILLVEPSTDAKPKFSLLVNEQPSLHTTSLIENKLADLIKEKLLSVQGIKKQFIDEINQVNVNLSTIKINENSQEKSSTGLSTIIGFIGAFLIYMFIFLYGVQVMKGVIEEKSNRIVEVLISSVKPFQLMMGKIVGIALVGLTQFVAWVLLVSVLSGTASGFVLDLMNVDAGQLAQTADTTAKAAKNTDLTGIVDGLASFSIIPYLFTFLFYFMGGYLFYGALFAAVGSAVDNETDTQQFMLPITMPLIFSFVLAQSLVINDPNGTIAFWLSIIPFTSPIVMMVRIPFDVPLWQIAISMASMVLGILFIVWLASRIYRIGILTFGKKPTYKEIWRWLFISN